MTARRPYVENLNVLASPAPEVRLEEFGDSAMGLALLCWISRPRDDLRVGSALRFAIDQGSRRDGIVIPCLQRDVHVNTEGAASRRRRDAPSRCSTGGR